MLYYNDNWNSQKVSKCVLGTKRHKGSVQHGNEVVAERDLCEEFKAS